MKRNQCNAFFGIVIGILLISFSGNPPNGRTGAPGETTCSGCHSIGSSTAEGFIEIAGLPSPVDAGVTYPIEIRIVKTAGGAARAGFQATAIDGNMNNSPSIGTWDNLGSNVGTATATVNGASRTYIEHNSGEITYNGPDLQDTVTYTADWTAPDPLSNNGIFLYAAGNIANGSGSGNDLIVTTSTGDITLPVELAYFQARAQPDHTVRLDWVTLSEISSHSFEVLRSSNGLNYELLKSIPAAGNSSQKIEYSFLDTQPIMNTTSYYKLKQMDRDGNFIYSNIEVVNVLSVKDYQVHLYPNPVKNNECLFIEVISDQDLENGQLEIFNANGQRAIVDVQLQSGVQKGFNKYVIETRRMPHGTYFLRVSDGKKLIDTKPIIVVE